VSSTLLKDGLMAVGGEFGGPSGESEQRQIGDKYNFNLFSQKSIQSPPFSPKFLWTCF
jgi:hypothetical protein